MKAADDFSGKTTAPNQLLADRLHLSEGRLLGLVIAVERARRLLALHHRLEAVRDDEGRGCLNSGATLTATLRTELVSPSVLYMF
jgi:hypothetical protein